MNSNKTITRDKNLTISKPDKTHNIKRTNQYIFLMYHKLKKAGEYLEDGAYDHIVKTTKKLPFSKRIIEGIKEYLHKQTDHQIAFGFAIGVFWGVMPTFGTAIIFAVPTAYLLRGSKAISIVGTFVSNPLTFPFYMGLAGLVSKSIGGAEFSKEALWIAVKSFNLSGILLTFLLSWAIVGLIFAVFFYLLLRWILKKYRHRQKMRIISIV